MTDDLAPSDLRTTAASVDGHVVLRAEGEIDLMTAERFQSALAEALEASRRLHVDLSEVSFMDSTGLRALLAARRRTEETGGAISVAVEPEGPVARLLDLAGVTDLFVAAEQDGHGA